MRESDLIALCRQLLELSSYNPVDSRVPELLLDTLLETGAEVREHNWRGIRNIVARTKGEPKVLFNGHWDTVLASPAQEGSLQVVCEDEYHLYGLGACDMKGGVAAMLAAFQQFAAERLPGIVLCLVGDEERGSRNGTARLVAEDVLAPMVVLGEPTALQISRGQKSGTKVHLEAKTRTAHAAYPHRGINAITQLGVVLEKLRRLFPDPLPATPLEEIFNSVTVVPTRIKGGVSDNSIPGECSATLDVRMGPRQSSHEVLQQVRAICDSERVSMTHAAVSQGWVLDESSPLCVAAIECLQKITNQPAATIVKMGSNDGRFYAARGCALVNVGPGDSRLSHTTEEKLSKKELCTCRDFYYLLGKALVDLS